MGAVVKNPITHLAQVSVPGATSAFFVDESLSRIRTINSKELRNLSSLLPVIVLIDQSTVKKLAVREMTDSKFLTETSESAKLLGLFGEALGVEPAGADSVVVFGDVTVSFSCFEVRRAGQAVAMTALEFK